eukprot:6200023-Pleurochrysis_carterae.AAC.1
MALCMFTESDASGSQYLHLSILSVFPSRADSRLALSLALARYQSFRDFASALPLLLPAPVPVRRAGHSDTGKFRGAVFLEFDSADAAQVRADARKQWLSQDALKFSPVSLLAPSFLPPSRLASLPFSLAPNRSPQSQTHLKSLPHLATRSFIDLLARWPLLHLSIHPSIST